MKSGQYVRLAAGRRTLKMCCYCIDYRGLSAITQKANYPLPRIDPSHGSLGGNTLFSCLDMRSSYWQVKVKDEDVDKTCFVTRKGICGFNVLPFGLCNAPLTFIDVPTSGRLGSGRSYVGGMFGLRRRSDCVLKEIFNV